MAERKVFLVPTLYVGDYYLEERSQSEAQAKMNALTRRYRAQHVDAVRKALRAGVRVGVGTDYVGFPPTQGVRELKLLVEAGMTPMQAIQAATRGNAELLRWQDRIGTVEPGKLADIIAVRGDPLQDLAVLERVGFVMLGGEVVCPGNGCPAAETSP
jgi:imidazolonepropionase-like amidohydrolase